ncbi:FtsX-like permease family protein [Paenibacillus aceris]|uniref:ABC transport system permease protein n=1 Tax=Paenibacillus aceris TaxID=869555 RepID=A0ABS4I1G7_9BACL|nr:ABC transporter permease [Paenibacillus aceris]MBP1963984.1 putative ABC transport system permease protein [Paenibacillus aceris]NHW34598.1 ABC transporter permease [Paenibacillus aceris]
MAMKSFNERKWTTLFISVQLIVSFYLICNGFIQLAMPDLASTMIQKHSNLDLNRAFTVFVPGTTSEQWFSERYSKLKQEIDNMNNVSGHGSFSTAQFFLLGLKNVEMYEAKNRELYKNTVLRGQEKLSYMVFLDESMFHSTKIDLYSGTTFSKADFMLAPTDTIPVWVGYDYKDTLRIGEEFSISWFGENLKYHIVGVMAKGSKWIDKNDYISEGVRDLDAAIVTPFLEYQMKFSPFIVTSLQRSTFFKMKDSKDISAIRSRINEVAANLGLATPIVHTIQEELDAYKSSKIELVKLNMFAGLFFLLTTSIGIITSSLSSIRARFYEFGVRKVYGESIISIARTIITEVFVLIMLSAIMGGVWNYYSNSIWSTTYSSSVLELFGIGIVFKLLVLASILTLSSVIYPIWFIYKRSPYTLIQGGES